MRKDIAQQQNSGRQESNTNDFLNIFSSGINRTRKDTLEDSNNDQEDQEEEEREELYDDEKDILKQFEENDKELEEIAA